jgi:tetratricopeptide (TPR) repeat protein
MILLMMSGLSYSQHRDHGLGHDHDESSYDKGIEFAAQGKFDEAKKEFDKARKAEPINRNVKMSLTIMEDVKNDTLKKKAALHLFRGMSEDHKGATGKAIIEFDKAVAVDPDYSLSYISRGMVYAKDGQYDNAISDYNKVIEIDRKNVKAYINRGIAHAKKGQLDLAIADYSRAIEMDGKDDDAYYNRGLAYTKQGQHDLAVSDYSTAIELNSKYANAYVNRGLTYMINLESKEKACSDWKRACELGSCNNYRVAQGKGYCD